eukprot:COSAG06_NODE_63105_length_263_cov_0.634146_1_plen_41_part_10
MPEGWTHRDRQDVSCHIVDITSTPLRAVIEEGIQATAHAKC